ncbi:MAG: cytidine deaminase [Flavobacteriales bacterium]|nr:MAG: cytidine deaminase [Flavobacteriales bacterium]
MEKEITIKYKIFENESALNEIEKKLFEKAKLSREKAYAPYSNFLVGCSILLQNGEIVTGNNQENGAYPSGTCAERTALYWASANFPNENIEKIFIVGALREFNESNLKPVPPCGSCRQSIAEYEIKQNQPIDIYFSSVSGKIYKISSIKSLLPFLFDGDTFLDK